jgi:hypothetical protein
MLRKLSILLLLLGYAALVGAAIWSAWVGTGKFAHDYMAKSGPPERQPDGVLVTRYVDGSPARLALPAGAAGLVLSCEFAPDGTLVSEGLLEGTQRRGTWIHGGASQTDFRTYPHSALPASPDPFTEGSVWSQGKLSSEQIECGDSGLRLEREYFDTGALRATGFRENGTPIGVWILFDTDGEPRLRCTSPEWRRLMDRE